MRRKVRRDATVWRGHHFGTEFAGAGAFLYNLHGLLRPYGHVSKKNPGEPEFVIKYTEMNESGCN